MTPAKPTVVFAQDAYLGIVAETYEKISTETGGVFLGKYIDGTWYVLETLDPGPNSIFRPSYFEYDEQYLTHLSNKTRRFYKNGLDLIGLWHRHPGSFDRFSHTDNGTNRKYADLSEEGAISALVNLDPGFRLTVYQVLRPLRYQKVQFQVGEEFVPPDLLVKKSVGDFTDGRYQRKHLAEGSHFTNSIDRGFTSQHKQVRARPRLSGIWHSLKRAIKPSGQSDVLVEQQSAVLDSILELIDGELNYLDLQHEYSYKLVMSTDGELVITMHYIHQMPYYPEKPVFYFGISKEYPKGYVRVEEGDTQPYTSSFIVNYITQRVNANSQKLGA